MCNRNSNDGTGRINIDEPRYDPDSYIGRLKGCFQCVNILNIFTRNNTLESARCLVVKYKCKEPLSVDVTEEQLWEAKKLYDSAYNPETGEIIPRIARPSTQIPIKMLITGGMLAFYNSTPGTIFWQWMHQSYIALVNYMTKSGTDPQIFTAYAVGSGTAVGTALGLNRLLRNHPSLVRRLVPLAAVLAANCLSTPLMKAQDIKNGIPVYDDSDNKMGYSRNAAQRRISQAIFDENLLVVPPMLFTPFLLEYLERRGTLCRYPWLNFPASAGFVGLCLLFVTPFACALIKEKGQIPYKHLDPELKEVLDKKYGCYRQPKYLYFNKKI